MKYPKKKIQENNRKRFVQNNKTHDARPSPEFITRFGTIASKSTGDTYRLSKTKTKKIPNSDHAPLPLFVYVSFFFFNPFS